MNPKEKERIETLLTALGAALDIGVSACNGVLGEGYTYIQHDLDDLEQLKTYAQSLRDELKKESEAQS